MGSQRLTARERGHRRKLSTTYRETLRHLLELTPRVIILESESDTNITSIKWS